MEVSKTNRANKKLKKQRLEGEGRTATKSLPKILPDNIMHS